MNDAERKQDSAATEALFEAVGREPWAHDFFALLRRLETLSPQAPRIGRARRPVHEKVRLGQVPELDFAPAALARFERDRAGMPHLGVRFFGLLGPQGPMPLHLTEFVRERLHQHGDPTAARFLDIFHLRLLSLFYRAWADAQPTVQMDRPTEDRYAVWLGASIGLRSGVATQDQVPDRAKLYQAGNLSGRSRHPEALAKVLRQYFGTAVKVHEHVPHWMPLPVQERTRLGHARNRAERLATPGGQLGLTANAGSKVYDRQYKFRVVLGPLSMAEYQTMLPGQTAWLALRDWIRRLAGPDLLFDVELGLRRQDIPEPRLGPRPDASTGGLRLGLTTWIGRRPATDRHDLRLRPGSSFLMRQHGAPHG